MDSPIVKATAQAGSLSTLSNIMAQCIACSRSGRPLSINGTELFHFSLFAVLNTPPNYIWGSWLESSFPGYTENLSHIENERPLDDSIAGTSSGLDTIGTTKERAIQGKDVGSMTEKPTTSKPREAVKKLNIKNTAIKFCLDQTVGAAVNTIVFIAGIALMRGHSLESIQQDIQEQFWPMIFAGQKLWPMVSLLNFTLVPFEYRTLFGSVVGLFWGIYLSMISSETK